MKHKSKLTQWTVTSLLFAWGMISFIVIASEPIDDNMAIGEFFLLKMLGIASLGLCALVWKRLDRAGLLPEMKDEEDCK